MKSKKINPDLYINCLGLTSLSDITLQQITSSYFLYSHGTGNIKKTGKVPVFQLEFILVKRKSLENVAVSNGECICSKAHETPVTHIQTWILIPSVKASRTILPFFRLFLYTCTYYHWAHSSHSEQMHWSRFNYLQVSDKSCSFFQLRFEFPQFM